MSELIPNILALDKGLDLQSPKLTAPPGSVLDSLNYEQVDFQGQKRIDGYTRYDGSPLAAVDDVLLVEAATTVDYSQYQIAVNAEGAPYGIATGFTTIGGVELHVIVVFDMNRIPNDAVWASVHPSPMMSADRHYALITQAQEYLRDNVGELPGAISGLHWFRDRLYAVVDIENYAPDDPRIDTDNNASLFVSRNIKQVMEEDSPGPYDFGWKFVHQGWWVNFKDGRVKSGKLTSKNQNRQNVGVQGPTSTEGDAGSAQLLQQRMTITNLPAQVNGWKTSTSPQVYNIEASALLDEDTVYIYADAFVSWDGETGTIVAPGIDGTGLVEYSPTNTVEVT